MIQNIRWNGKPVAFSRLPDGKRFVRTRRRIGEKDVCPLCKQDFDEDTVTSVTLIVSNQTGVPNRFVHDECLADKTDENAFRLIAEDYEKAKQAAEEFRGWNLS